MYSELLGIRWVQVWDWTRSSKMSWKFKEWKLVSKLWKQKQNAKLRRTKGCAASFFVWNYLGRYDRFFVYSKRGGTQASPLQAEREMEEEEEEEREQQILVVKMMWVLSVYKCTSVQLLYTKIAYKRQPLDCVLVFEQFSTQCKAKCWVDVRDSWRMQLILYKQQGIRPLMCTNKSTR